MVGGGMHCGQAKAGWDAGTQHEGDCRKGAHGGESGKGNRKPVRRAGCTRGSHLVEGHVAVLFEALQDPHHLAAEALGLLRGRGE